MRAAGVALDHLVEDRDAGALLRPVPLRVGVHHAEQVPALLLAVCGGDNIHGGILSCGLQNRARPGGSIALVRSRLRAGPDAKPYSMIVQKLRGFAVGYKRGEAVGQ